jgi:hypothetical protein
MTLEYTALARARGSGGVSELWLAYIGELVLPRDDSRGKV